MNPMSEYKVEKDRFSVKLFFLDGTSKEGHIFLSLQAAHHEGHELVMDVLNESEPFLPIKFLDGPTKLINKSNLLMISFPSDEREDPGGDPALEKTEAQVAIHLVNDTRLDGSFLFVLPNHARRVKDFLNQTACYLELRKNGETYLINKDHILYVEEK